MIKKVSIVLASSRYDLLERHQILVDEAKSLALNTQICIPRIKLSCTTNLVPGDSTLQSIEFRVITHKISKKDSLCDSLTIPFSPKTKFTFYEFQGFDSGMFAALYS